MIGRSLAVNIPLMDDIEETYYEIAKEAFNEPGYQMPPLKWLDRHKMQSALGAVTNSYYQNIPDLGAALVYYINKNHPFLDGNKRMSVIMLFSFLVLNGYFLSQPLSAQEGVDFVESIAKSNRTDKDEIINETSEWIAKHFHFDKYLLASLSDEV
jgi:death-on-curing protein